MADGVFTVTSPTATNVVTTDIDEVRENFEYLRRHMMNLCTPPITGAIATYTYTGSNLTGITYSGTLAGSAVFTYTGDNLTQEVWTLYGKTLTYTHSYPAGVLTTTTVTVA
jgi:hypothetical protein